MFTSNERGIRKQAQVDFTRSGWRQFSGSIAVGVRNSSDDSFSAMNWRLT